MLAIVVLGGGLVGYELNWIRQRRLARAEYGRFFAQVTGGVDAGFRVELYTLKPRTAGTGFVDRFSIWALDENCGACPVPWPMRDAKVLALIGDKQLTSEAIEAIEAMGRVRRARWLFPEAGIGFLYMTDAEPVSGGRPE
jgi:hypothetical protein